MKQQQGQQTSNPDRYPGQHHWLAPDTPPSKMDKSGRSVDMYQRADRYRKLDSISAKEMSKVKTGVPDIDKIVKTQVNQPKYPKDFSTLVLGEIVLKVYLSLIKKYFYLSSWTNLV